MTTTLKQQAAKKFAHGNIQSAIDIYTSTLEKLQNCPSKRLRAQEEATIYNQLAFCYNRLGCSLQVEIDLSSETIARSLFLTDLNVAKRAYLRRGLALENSGRFEEATADL